MKYILSVVIPTRNNEQYLLQSVKQVLSVTSENIQIVVQNNGDTNEAESMISGLNSARIKYNYDQTRLSIVDNFSKALSLTEGKYVIMIGDDDGVLPTIEKFTLLAEEYDIDVLVPSISYEYFWPNSVEINNSLTGVVRFLESKYKLKKVDAFQEVIKLLKNGCQDYNSLKVGKLYHGIVKKEILEIIYKKNKVYFGGLVPDIYMAVATSLIAKSIYHLSIPLTIAGVCPSSGSSQASNGLHTGELHEAPQLVGRTSEYKWSSLVPEFYSVETIWADSALAAVKDMGYEDILKYFSIDIISARLYLNYKDYKEPITDSYLKNTNDYNIFQKIKSKITIFIYPLFWFIQKVLKRLSRLNKNMFYFYDINDIIAASDKYKETFVFQKLQGKDNV